MIAFRIPKITVWNGNTYYNDKIMRRLMRQIGGGLTGTAAILAAD